MNKAYHHFTDEQLVRCYQTEGDPRYVGELYNRHHHLVYRRCLQITGDAFMAEDCAHEVFIRVHGRLNQFKIKSRFSTWLYATYNYCISQIPPRKPAIFVPLSQDILDREFPGHTPDEERWSVYLDSLKRLNELEHQLMAMRYVEGKKLAEIGDLLNLSVSAVKMRIKRVRRKITDYIRRNYESD